MRWLRALRSWAIRDRIRASPDDGKLLQLRPGACVRVDDEFAEVIDRSECDRGGDAGSAEVIYACRSGAGTEFQLRVHRTPSGTTRVQCGTHPVGERCLEPGDIEVFG